MVEDSNKKWSRASFRAFSESFTVKQIGEILGLAPTESFSIGDPISSASSQTRRYNGFFIKSSVSTSRPMPEHLEEILSALESARMSPSSLDSSIDSGLYLGFSSLNSQGGFEIPPAMLERIAKLGIPMDLDLYPPGAGSE